MSILYWIFQVRFPPVGPLDFNPPLLITTYLLAQVSQSTSWQHLCDLSLDRCVQGTCGLQLLLCEITRPFSEGFECKGMQITYNFALVWVGLSSSSRHYWRFKVVSALVENIFKLANSKSYRFSFSHVFTFYPWFNVVFSVIFYLLCVCSYAYAYWVWSLLNIAFVVALILYTIFWCSQGENAQNWYIHVYSSKLGEDCILAGKASHTATLTTLPSSQGIIYQSLW